MSSKKLFVFGLGYTASRAARAFYYSGYQISGTVRSIEAAAQLSQTDATLFRFEGSKTSPPNIFLFDGKEWSDNNSLTLEEALREVTHLLISVPTGHVDGQEDIVLSSLGDHLIPATKDSVQWVGYLSTIGVYGETNGVSVDESAPVQSSVRRSQLRIKAEQLWLDSQLPAHIFRIAGIYGPGRGIITRARSGTATRLHIPGHKFNRIHVDDIVNVLLASAARPNPGGIYNVCDDEPAPADEVTAYACELLGVSVPPLQSWDEVEKSMSAMAKSFYAESKLCANQRIKDELGVKLLYPTYREGFLAQVLEEDKLVENKPNNPIDGVFGQSSLTPHLIVLVNIGSLRAEPFLHLRQVSFRLSRALRQPVIPCSFQYSDRVDPQKLNGLKAKTFETVLIDHLSTHNDCASDVIVLPLILETVALTEFMPKTIDKVRAASPSALITVRVGKPLVEDADDTRVARILLERINQILDFKIVQEDVTILVVDRGTSRCDVHEAREVVAQQLRELLETNPHVKLIGTARLKNHNGAQYDCKDPLLANALDHYSISKGLVVFGTLFFSNGHRAVDKEDIEDILLNVRARNPEVDVRVTDALETHELLSEILQDRYYAALRKEVPDYSLTATE